MFNRLKDNLGSIFDRLRGRGLLTEADIDTAMREIRIALLEADVSLPVVKEFITQVKQAAIGQEVIKSISPGQLIVKIVHDQLTAMLGTEHTGIISTGKTPLVIMMVGLQGAGKTTSTGKLATYLKQQGKRILVASLDTARPAAQQQLAILAEKAAVTALPIVAGEQPLAITRRAMDMAKLQADILILDTAGRLHTDDTLMAELVDIKKLAQPDEILLVADALTGQDAVNIANHFHQHLTVTGLILTRIDADGRGGAALSMKAATGCPIKFLSTGELLADFEAFHPDRIAGRILDMGDIVSFVEKAQASVDEEEAEALAKKMQKGKFDLNDLAKQLQMVRKMGGIGGMLGSLPGLGKLTQQLRPEQMDDKLITRQLAIISSMTSIERRNIKLLNASRKRRIAMGCGQDVAAVNRLLKQYMTMETMMKRLKGMDPKAMMRGGLGNMFRR
jgi:signal recognition particle subunit SRP54